MNVHRRGRSTTNEAQTSIGSRRNRREMLRQLGTGLAGLGTPAATSLMLSQAGRIATAQQPNDYKALVCLFLLGGNDSFNMLVPMDGADVDGQGGYAGYVAARGGRYDQSSGGLGLPAELVHPISDATTGRPFGLHPAMPEVADLFREGSVSMLSNIGSLVRPITIEDYHAKAANPLGLFSHSDLQKHWMTALPSDEHASTGWLGRVTDWHNANEPPGIFPITFSINQTNLLQTGWASQPYVIADGGETEVSAYQNVGDPISDLTAAVTDRWLNRDYGNRFHQVFRDDVRRSIELSSQFNAALASGDPMTEFFLDAESSVLQSQLRRVAQTIAAHSTLGQRRQTFFVGIGGWDHHYELIQSQDRLLGALSKAIDTFFGAMRSLGLGEQVVTFTASDFGRTLSSNGRGTDHGWGGNQMVISDAVVGGRVFGDYPQDLTDIADLDVGRGRLLPTTSVDEMAAELAAWFGVPVGEEMELVLPNLRSFVPDPTPRPIGFLAT